VDTSRVINATGWTLRGQALQEWKLLLSEDKMTYQAAVKALKERLDPGNQT